ncbi:MAG: phosphatase PAP2 family protein [Acidimicrobiia bacterium]
MQAIDERPRAALRLRWWREVLYIASFYGVYTLVRNTFGSASVSPRHAFNNAKHVISLEKALGLYHEQRIQDWFIGYDAFLRFWNIYYGSLHFIVTGGALIWCYRRRPHRYAVARNTLAATTGLALVGFSFFPLMPPRLLDATGPYGGASLHGGSYGFVDTLASVGGLWSFDSGAMQDISNQYAAMPSLHCAWALWCTFVLWALWTRPWQRVVLVLYPIATLFCIVVTANHYWIDGLGGVATLLVGYGVARSIEARWWQRQLDERDERAALESDDGDPTRAEAVDVPDEAAL